MKTNINKSYGKLYYQTKTKKYIVMNGVRSINKLENMVKWSLEQWYQNSNPSSEGVSQITLAYVQI